MIHLLFKFLEQKICAQIKFKVLILVPEHTRAPWFRFLKNYERVAPFRTGSDLFCLCSSAGEWVKAPATKEAWVVLKR